MTKSISIEKMRAEVFPSSERKHLYRGNNFTYANSYLTKPHREPYCP